MNNTQWIYIFKSYEDIQVQCDMHLQEASILVARDDNFIAQETTSRYSKLRKEYSRSVRLTTFRYLTCFRGKSGGPRSSCIEIY
jgi:hypothetical protein